MWYFEEGGVILRRWWCGTLERVVRYFERVVRYYEEGHAALLKRLLRYFKMVVSYFENSSKLQNYIIYCLMI